MYVALPSLLVTASVTAAARASLSDALPLAPLATSVAVTVLISGLATIAAANVTGTVNVSALPPPCAIVAPLAPTLASPVAPTSVPHDAMPVATQVASAASVAPVGSASATETFKASDAPVFATVIVYVALPPGVYVALPSLFVTASVTAAARMSLSDAAPLAPDATSTADAVFTSGSAARPGANATGALNVSALPPPAPIDAPVVPNAACPEVPLTVPQLALPDGVHVTVALNVTPAGSASVTLTASASDVPPLETVTV